MENGDKFDIGKTYWSEGGQMVELIAITTDGQYVVSELIEFDDFEETRTFPGKIVLEHAIFTDPPRYKVDEELMALREESRKLESMNSRSRSSAINAEYDVRQRLDKLKKYKGLELIEELIEGRITHVLIEEYADYEIKTFVDAFNPEDDYSRRDGLKLLVLFGKSNGDMTWQLNQYCDGFGSKKRIIPCLSEADAVDRRKFEIEQMLLDRFSQMELNNNYQGYFALGVKCAIKYGVPVSDEMLTVYRKIEIARKTTERAKLENSLAVTMAKIAALETDGDHEPETTF